MNNVAATEQSFEVRVELVETGWPNKGGWYIAVRNDAARGDLWMKTRSASTAARMIPYGFKGTCLTEARMSNLRLRDIPVYP